MEHDHETSERGEINSGFLERVNDLRQKDDEKDGYRFHTDKAVKLSLSATRGHDIRNWTTEKTAEMEAGDVMTFECGQDEFRLKLLGVEEYTQSQSFRPDGLQPRIAIDRFETDTEEWVEYVEKSGPENCVVVLDLSFSVDVEEL